MPERTFGRMVRYRRTKLGLSQAQLGELVGRSPATVRSWERDQSQPTDSSVLAALSAVLGVEEKMLFGKAGQDVPETEETPTVEQALATLAPEDVIDLNEVAGASVVISPEDFDVTPDPEILAPDPATPDHEAEQLQMPSETAPVIVGAPHELTPSSSNGYDEPAFSSTSPGYFVTTAVPPAHEPSYMEDSSQRQLYRVRNLATIVFLVALGIALIWAFTEGWSAFTTWWDDFFGSLRL